MKPDLALERPNFWSKKPDLRSERSDFGFERPNFRADCGSEISL